MDTTKKYNNPSPETKATWVSKLFFGWVLGFFKYGYKNDLEMKDIYNALPADLSEPLGNLLEKNWNKEQIKAKNGDRKPSLGRAIVHTFYKIYMFYGVIMFLHATILRLLHPIVLAEFINFFDVANESTLTEGWLYSSCVVLISFLNCLIMHHSILQCIRIGMRCRIACCSLLYRKLLRLNRTSLGKTAAGQLVNLMSNDVQRFDIAAGFLHYIWIMPIQAIVAACIMYDSVGSSALIGLFAMLVQALLLQGYLSKLQGQLRSKIAVRTDVRVKLMSEITSGIQVIKMYAWEAPFNKIVQLARKLEIDALTTTSYIRGITVALMVFTERFTLYLTVISYVLMGNRLTSDKVFSLSQFFNIIQLYMSIFFPFGIVMLAESKVSIKRLEDFLTLEEVNLTLPVTDKTTSETKGSIKIKNAKATWIPNPIIETLSDINLNIKPGSLTAVIGTVGSGKSSLLQLILKELPLRMGNLEINGDVSYTSQEPWLFASSVRNNILFGQQFVRSVYSEVVRVCALTKDFEQLPHGDKTLVGERGVSLSGGQRARINLARSIYRQADIYLLDDPLSAVDAKVANQLFHECIVTYLKDKTRILVTHQLQFLKRVDQIIIINNGQIEKIGTFEELSENELAYLTQEANVEDDQKSPEKEKPVIKRLMSIQSEHSSNQDVNEPNESEETQELMEKGAISTSLYKKYFNAGANLFSLILLGLLILIAQAFSNAGDLWVTHWTNNVEVQEKLILNKTLEDLANDTSNIDNVTSPIGHINKTIFEHLPLDDENTYYISFYTFFILGSIILTTLRSLLFFKVCMRASRNLHNSMFSNLLHATMRFFDTNPSGRILTRFSKDMGNIDETLPRAMLDSIQIFMVMFGILIMVFICIPWMIIPTILLGVLFIYLRIIYLSSAQDIKRLEGITRAPVFSHVSASLSGLTTIRSSNAQYMVSKEFDILQDRHTGSWYLFLVTTETFGFYLDVICVVFLAVVAFQFLIFDDGNTLPGNVGLVISQSLILTGMLQHGIRQTAEVASQMTSVERVLQYSKIEKEGPFQSTPTKKPHRDWPNKGNVTFKNLYLKYVPEDDPVLQNLNINITAGEKIGIVGRTGAGKSSLISALFRLAPIDGAISIDEINTKEIGLYDLRTKISIIPQEPILFSASVRHNLDPFDKCDDATLWQALEDVELKDTIESLDQEVTEGGTNFSVGQRQLICLARAIIKNNKVLILDEATANVDPQTDFLIQATIRKNFKDCTVLTIAHRLNTIMDSDKVLVMNNGQAVEFGVPHELLQVENGYFNNMLKETGPNMEAKLRKVAKDTYLSMRQKEKINEDEQQQQQETNDNKQESAEKSNGDIVIAPSGKLGEINEEDETVEEDEEDKATEQTSLTKPD